MPGPSGPKACPHAGGTSTDRTVGVTDEQRAQLAFRKLTERSSFTCKFILKISGVREVDLLEFVAK